MAQIIDFMKRTRRQEIEADRAQMENDRAGFLPLYRELGGLG